MKNLSYTIYILIAFLLIILQVNCGGDSGDGVIPNVNNQTLDTGSVEIKIDWPEVGEELSAQVIQPEVSEIVITITGSGLTEPRIVFIPRGVNTKSITGIPIGEKVFDFEGRNSSGNVLSHRQTNVFILKDQVVSVDAWLGVSILNSGFYPSTIYISKGDTLYWANNDTGNHTATADNSSFNSGTISPGGEYSRTFNSPGTINYHCANSGFNGTIIVNGTSPTSTPSPTATQSSSPTPTPTTNPSLYYQANLSYESSSTTVVRYQTKQLRVEFQNTGNVAWDPDVVHLGTAPPPSYDRDTHLSVSDGYWIMDNPSNRIKMTNSSPVQPGQTAVFLFSISPDSQYNSSNQGFELVADDYYQGVPNQWFGSDGYVDIYVTVENPYYQANLTYESPATTVTRYQTKQLQINFTNTGNVAWDPDVVHLGTAPPPSYDRDTHLSVNDGNWIIDNPTNRINMVGTSDIPPGQTAVFSFDISPDSQYNSSNQGFELVADSSYMGLPNQRFGNDGYVDIYVTVEDPYYLAQLTSSPSNVSIQRYTSQQVTVQFRNDGNVPWDPDVVHLGTAPPPSYDRNTNLYTSNDYWITQDRIKMINTSPVQPGQTATFRFKMTPDSQFVDSTQGFELVGDSTYMGVPNQWFGNDGYVSFWVDVY